MTDSSTSMTSPPAAFGIGMATVASADDSVLDVWYPVVVGSEGADTASRAAAAIGVATEGTHELTPAAITALGEQLSEVAEGGDGYEIVSLWANPLPDEPVLPVRRVPVVTFIAALDAPPADAHDVYLRLHLLSSRIIRPHGCSLEGQFGLLSNVVWTDHGPCDVASFDAARRRLRAAGTSVTVWSVDKFPRMVDYVIPSGVRIGDADRVRLGAHLAEGTTVMHEGFVNFNAGTLGPSMVEGRISAGVVVGPDSDVGGGASIMGTLSGGGTEVISIGQGCLLGANAGIGISLGDRCVVEAGLYVTAGTRVTTPGGEVVKARDLSGVADLLFRRNSTSGAVEVLPRQGAWSEGLNEALHAN